MTLDIKVKDNTNYFYSGTYQFRITNERITITFPKFDSAELSYDIIYIEDLVYAHTDNIVEFKALNAWFGDGVIRLV